MMDGLEKKVQTFQNDLQLQITSNMETEKGSVDQICRAAL